MSSFKSSVSLNVIFLCLKWNDNSASFSWLLSKSRKFCAAVNSNLFGCSPYSCSLQFFLSVFILGVRGRTFVFCV